MTQDRNTKLLDMNPEMVQIGILYQNELVHSISITSDCQWTPVNSTFVPTMNLRRYLSLFYSKNLSREPRNNVEIDYMNLQGSYMQGARVHGRTREDTAYNSGETTNCNSSERSESVTILYSEPSGFCDSISQLQAHESFKTSKEMFNHSIAHITGSQFVHQNEHMDLESDEADDMISDLQQSSSKSFGMSEVRKTKNQSSCVSDHFHSSDSNEPLNIEEFCRRQERKLSRKKRSKRPLSGNNRFNEERSRPSPIRPASTSQMDRKPCVWQMFNMLALPLDSDDSQVKPRTVHHNMRTIADVWDPSQPTHYIQPPTKTKQKTCRKIPCYKSARVQQKSDPVTQSCENPYKVRDSRSPPDSKIQCCKTPFQCIVTQRSSRKKFTLNHPEGHDRGCSCCPDGCQCAIDPDIGVTEETEWLTRIQETHPVYGEQQWQQINRVPYPSQNDEFAKYLAQYRTFGTPLPATTSRFTQTTGSPTTFISVPSSVPNENRLKQTSMRSSYFNNGLTRTTPEFNERQASAQEGLAGVSQSTFGARFGINSQSDRVPPELTIGDKGLTNHIIPIGSEPFYSIPLLSGPHSTGGYEVPGYVVALPDGRTLPTYLAVGPYQNMQHLAPTVTEQRIVPENQRLKSENIRLASREATVDQRGAIPNTSTAALSAILYPVDYYGQPRPVQFSTSLPHVPPSIREMVNHLRSSDTNNTIFRSKSAPPITHPTRRTEKSSTSKSPVNRPTSAASNQPSTVKTQKPPALQILATIPSSTSTDLSPFIRTERPTTPHSPATPPTSISSRMSPIARIENPVAFHRVDPPHSVHKIKNKTQLERTMTPEIIHNGTVESSRTLKRYDDLQSEVSKSYANLSVCLRPESDCVEMRDGQNCLCRLYTLSQTSEHQWSESEQRAKQFNVKEVPLLRDSDSSNVLTEFSTSDTSTNDKRPRISGGHRMRHEKYDPIDKNNSETDNGSRSHISVHHHSSTAAIQPRVRFSTYPQIERIPANQNRSPAEVYSKIAMWTEMKERLSEDHATDQNAVSVANAPRSEVTESDSPTERPEMKRLASAENSNYSSEVTTSWAGRDVFRDFDYSTDTSDSSNVTKRSEDLRTIMDHSINKNAFLPNATSHNLEPLIKRTKSVEPNDTPPGVCNVEKPTDGLDFADSPTACESNKKETNVILPPRFSDTHRTLTVPTLSCIETPTMDRGSQTYPAPVRTYDGLPSSGLFFPGGHYEDRAKASQMTSSCDQTQQVTTQIYQPSEDSPSAANAPDPWVTRTPIGRIRGVKRSILKAQSITSCELNLYSSDHVNIQSSVEYTQYIEQSKTMEVPPNKPTICDSEKKLFETAIHGGLDRVEDTLYAIGSLTGSDIDEYTALGEDHHACHLFQGDVNDTCLMQFTSNHTRSASVPQTIISNYGPVRNDLASACLKRTYRRTCSFPRYLSKIWRPACIMYQHHRPAGDKMYVVSSIPHLPVARSSQASFLCLGTPKLNRTDTDLLEERSKFNRKETRLDRPLTPPRSRACIPVNSKALESTEPSNSEMTELNSFQTALTSDQLSRSRFDKYVRSNCTSVNQQPVLVALESPVFQEEASLDRKVVGQFRHFNFTSTKDMSRLLSTRLDNGPGDSDSSNSVMQKPRDGEYPSGSYLRPPDDYSRPMTRLHEVTKSHIIRELHSDLCARSRSLPTLPSPRGAIDYLKYFRQNGSPEGQNHRPKSSACHQTGEAETSEHRKTTQTAKSPRSDLYESDCCRIYLQPIFIPKISINQSKHGAGVWMKHSTSPPVFRTSYTSHRGFRKRANWTTLNLRRSGRH